MNVIKLLEIKIYPNNKLLFKVFVKPSFQNNIPLLADVFSGVECSPVDFDKDDDLKR